MLSPNQKELSRGKNGIVYYKALNCKDTTQPSGNYVSKLMTSKKAAEEYSHADKIRTTIPNGAIYPEHICESSYVKGNKDTLLFSKFGGFPIVNYFNYLDLYNENTNEKFDIDYWNTFMGALYNLREQIAIMNSKGLYHNDMNYENILYNEEMGKMFLIDFAEATDKPKVSRFTGKPIIDVIELDSMIGTLVMLKEHAQNIDIRRGGRRRKTRKRR